MTSYVRFGLNKLQIVDLTGNLSRYCHLPKSSSEITLSKILHHVENSFSDLCQFQYTV